MGLEGVTAWTKNKRTLLVLTLLLVVLGTPQANATIQLRLSDYASDGINPPLPEDMDAMLTFDVVGSTLTLAVENLTPEIDGVDPELNINEIYFNAAANVTGLTLTDVIGSPLSKWDSEFIQGGGPTDIGNPHQVNGFGKFDMYLIDGVDDQPHVIDPGETVTFIMSITGTGPFEDADFAYQWSAQVDGHILSRAAAKFYNGPPEMSAYGNNVPEPATICLFGFGALALLRKRKRT